MSIRINLRNHRRLSLLSKLGHNFENITECVPYLSPSCLSVLVRVFANDIIKFLNEELQRRKVKMYELLKNNYFIP